MSDNGNIPPSDIAHEVWVVGTTLSDEAQAAAVQKASRRFRSGSLNRSYGFVHKLERVGIRENANCIGKSNPMEPLVANGLAVIPLEDHRFGIRFNWTQPGDTAS